MEDVVAAKLGDVWVVGDEVVQEVGQLVALAQRHVGAHQVLVHHPQVKVIAEGVHVHQVPHFIALLSEEHRQLQHRRTGLSSPPPSFTFLQVNTQTDWGTAPPASLYQDLALPSLMVPLVTLHEG